MPPLSLLVVVSAVVEAGKSKNVTQDVGKDNAYPVVGFGNWD